MSEETDDYLTISLSMQSLTDRNNVNIDYDMHEGGYGAMSVYRKFDNKQFVVYLRDIDIEGQTIIGLRIADDVMVDGKIPFILKASFSESADDSDCTIYWGDGEMNEDIISSDFTEPINGSIVKDGRVHSYVHYYYVSGDFNISIGRGLRSFSCGNDDYDDGTSKKLVYRCIAYSDSENLTSSSGAFADCINMVGPIPEWGEHIVDASRTYYGCTSLSVSSIPNWNDEMTDISECYCGCTEIGTYSN